MYKVIKTKPLPQAFNIIEGLVDYIPRMGVYMYSNENSQWLQIGVNDEELYTYLIDVLGDLVEKETRAPVKITPPAPAFLEYGSVTAETGLNIRAGATTKDNIVGVLDLGQRVKIVDKVGDWFKIELPCNGFVYAPYITMQETPATVNIDLVRFTESWEGFSATPYQDAGGNWTIGFGNCSYNERPNYTVTRAEAEKNLEITLNQIGQNIKNSLGYLCFSQDQFNSLVDFCYNLGFESLLNSTLLKNIKLCKDNATLINDFNMWDYCNGQQLTGLLNRRKAEGQLFLYGAYDNN